MFKPSRLLRPSDARRRARGDLGTDSVRPELPLFYVPVSPVARVAICKPCPVALVPTLGLQL